MIFFDLECTRFDVRAPIAWIAAVRTSPLPEFRIEESFSVRVQFPESKADPDCLEVFRYRREIWEARAIPLGDAVERLDAFVLRDKDRFRRCNKEGKEYEVVRTAGYNVHFDVDRLLSSIERGGHGYVHIDPGALCIRQLYLWQHHLLGEGPVSSELSAVAQHFGYQGRRPERGPRWHNPLEDCHATIHVAQKLAERFDRDATKNWNCWRKHLEDDLPF